MSFSNLYSIEELIKIGVKVKGKNIKISKFVNIYNPSNLILHDNIRIDDFTILSCKGLIEIYDFVRISSHCLLTSESKIIIHKYSNISSGVKFFGGMDNTNNKLLTNPLIPNKYNEIDKGDIILKEHSIIGSNSIITPNIIIEEGTMVKPLSFVNKNTEPWKIYEGNPIKFIKNRNINHKIIKDLDNEIFFDDLYNEEIDNNEITSFVENKNTTQIINNGVSEKLNILITGGAKGIGRNIAIHFLNQGHNVIITYYHSQNEAEELKKMGIHIFQLNITNNSESKIVINKMIEEFKFINVLINNAGIIKNNLFHKMSYEDWSSVIDTNLISLYTITHPVINNMLENKKGKIINISSISGLKVSKGQSNYCSSKFGIIGFTKTLALEYGRSNIQTNCICPGLVDTDMLKEINSKVLDKIINDIPVNKLIHPNEISAICDLFVKSDTCNGTVFNIDGGMNS